MREMKVWASTHHGSMRIHGNDPTLVAMATKYNRSTKTLKEHINTLITKCRNGRAGITRVPPVKPADGAADEVVEAYRTLHNNYYQEVYGYMVAHHETCGPRAWWNQDAVTLVSELDLASEARTGNTGQVQTAAHLQPAGAQLDQILNKADAERRGRADLVRERHEKDEAAAEEAKKFRSDMCGNLRGLNDTLLLLVNTPTGGGAVPVTPDPQVAVLTGKVGALEGGLQEMSTKLGDITNLLHVVADRLNK